MDDSTMAEHGVRHGGGCLCGGIRYQITADPLIMGYCHCRVCQKATGAPVFAAVVVSRQDFRLLRGSPRRYQSSARGVRHFCGDCGTPLFFEPLDLAEKWEVLAGTLDDPNWVQPAAHIWTSSQVPWLQIDDDLPRFRENRPPGFGERHFGG